MNEPTPEKIEQFLKLGRAILGIQDTWKINVQMENRPGYADSIAITTSNPRYMVSTIEFSPDVLTEEIQTRAIHILHELIHVSAAEVHHICCEILDLLPEEKRKIYSDFYTDANERLTEKSARALINFLAANTEIINALNDPTKSDQ